MAEVWEGIVSTDPAARQLQNFVPQLNADETKSSVDFSASDIYGSKWQGDHAVHSTMAMVCSGDSAAVHDSPGQNPACRGEAHLSRFV
jgi:hypothetical protein